LPVPRHLVKAVLNGLAGTGVPQLRDFDEIALMLETWRDPATRRAIRHLVSNVVDLRGQIVTMRDRAYLTESMPMCVIWGSDDAVLPVLHAEYAAEIAPTATVEVISNAGHFPHKDHPERFVKIINDFIRSTEPAVYKRGKWRHLLVTGSQGPVPTTHDEVAVTA